MGQPDRGARSHRRPVPPLPVLPRLPDRRGARDAGPRHRLAGGAQMGRHPRPADPAGRRTLALVAGRGADHRPLPRTGATARFPAPRHRDRRRGPGLGPRGRGPLPFARLQPRIGRKTVPKKLLTEAPVILMAYDLLEWGGRDWRDRPLSPSGARNSKPSPICLPTCPSASPPAVAADWPDLAKARAPKAARSAPRG
jgi:hypothetical protein